MIVERAGINGPAVVILGAGASRGEHFTRKQSTSSGLPPLDSDFFNQVQKLPKGSDHASRMLHTARQLFGPVPSATMEEFFTRVEFLAKFTEVREKHTHDQPLWKGRHPPFRDQYDGAILAFRAALLEVLTQAGVAEGPLAESPRLHAFLVDCLSPQDFVITFNYDTLIDCALRQNGFDKWHADIGYSGVDEGDFDYWSPVGSPARTGGYRGISLLKMHGSVNWETSEYPQSKSPYIRLAKPPFDPAKMHIVPPEWNKGVGLEGLLAPIWFKAWLGLAVIASSLVVVGYSLPRTDMWMQALLRDAVLMRLSPFSDVIIANPDSAATERFMAQISPAVGPATRVVRLNDFEELCRYFGIVDL